MTKENLTMRTLGAIWHRRAQEVNLGNHYETQAALYFVLAILAQDHDHPIWAIAFFILAIIDAIAAIRKYTT